MGVRNQCARVSLSLSRHPYLTLHVHPPTQSDQLAGAFLLAVAVIVFVYYTLWVIILVRSQPRGSESSAVGGWCVLVWLGACPGRAEWRHIFFQISVSTSPPLRPTYCDAWHSPSCFPLKHLRDCTTFSCWLVLTMLLCELRLS